MSEEMLCMGCMAPKTTQGICDVCGYDASIPADPEDLPPGTRLGNRYIVGRVSASDPEGLSYVGYDLQTRQRVCIREYAPAGIARRDSRDFGMYPLPGREAQYKALMADFEDLCANIRGLSAGEKVFPILNMLHENHTTYAVYRYIKTISLKAFFNRKGGRLPWQHTKKLLMPLFHTVANLHKAGIIHRGISPETVYLDQTGALWLGSFTIAAARTRKSELPAELTGGYYAPEQYSANSWQGTWTDIYALGALTYRAVTGKEPPPALDRVYGDDLLHVGMNGLDMTENTINAINKALAFEVEDRTQTAEQYIADLLATEGSNTAVYTTPVTRGRITQEEYSPAGSAPPALLERTSTPSRSGASRSSTRQSAGTRRRKKNKKARPVLSLILTALLATAALGFGMYWVATNYLEDLIFPPDESAQTQSSIATPDTTQSEAGATVPSLIGQNAQVLKADEELNSRFTLVFESAYNDAYEAGIVFDQHPREGANAQAASELTLYVSSGPESVSVPALEGLSLEEATDLLNAQKIPFDIIPVFNKTYEPGMVARVDKAEGTIISRNKDIVILYTRMETESVSSEEGEPEDDPEADDKERTAARKRQDKKSTRSQLDD